MSQVTRGEDVPTALSVRDEDVPTADLLPRRLSLSTVGTALDVKHIGDLSVKIVGRSSDDDGVIRYTIQLTGPDGWTILRRRYRDFEELHRQLLAGNPQAIAMPPKKYFRSIFSPKFQDEREQRLGEVAAACLESVAHEELDDCPPALRRFLGLMDVSSSFLSAPEKDASPSLPSALADLCLDGLWIHNGAPIARVAGSELHWLADGEIVSHLEPISGGVWSIEMDGEQFEAEASREGNELRLLWSDGEVWTHSNESAEAVKSHEKDQRLADIFNQLDRNGDGSVNKRELIKACANSKDIADLFCLPQRIRQEDGSREEFERIFQDIDANDDREIDWAEFKAAFAAHTESAEFAGAASAASPDVKSGPAPSALPQASEKSSEVSLREKACAALTEASANGRLVEVLESVRGPAAAPAAEDAQSLQESFQSALSAPPAEPADPPREVDIPLAQPVAEEPAPIIMQDSATTRSPSKSKQFIEDLKSKAIAVLTGGKAAQVAPQVASKEEVLREKACKFLLDAAQSGQLDLVLKDVRGTPDSTEAAEKKELCPQPKQQEQVQTTTCAWIPHPCMFGANLGMAGTMHGAHLASASRSQPLSAAKKEAGPDEFMNAMRRHLEASAKSSEERADCPGDSPEAQRSPPAPLSRELAPQSASSSVPSKQYQAKQECANPAGDFRQVPPSALSPLYSQFAPKKAELLAQPAQLATQDGVVTFGPGEYGPVRQVTPETPKAKPVSSDPSEGPRDQDEPKGLVQGLMGKVTELFYKAPPDHEAAAAEARKEAQVRLREKACAALTEASANGRLVQVLESVRGPAAAPAAETQLVSIENKLTKSSDGWPTRQAPEDDVAESDEACSNVLRGTTEVCGRKFKVDAAFCEGCGNRRAEEGPASPSRMRSAKIDAPPPSDGQEDVGYQQEKLKAEVAAAKTSSDKFDVYLSKIQEALEQNSDEALVQPEEGKPSACCRAAPALCTAAAVVALAAASASSRRRNGL